MIQEHVAATNSVKGKQILDSFTDYLPKFKKIIPHDYNRMHDGNRADGGKGSEQSSRHRLKHSMRMRESKEERRWENRLDLWNMNEKKADQ